MTSGKLQDAALWWVLRSASGRLLPLLEWPLGTEAAPRPAPGCLARLRAVGAVSMDGRGRGASQDARVDSDLRAGSGCLTLAHPWGSADTLWRRPGPGVPPPYSPEPALHVAMEVYFSGKEGTPIISEKRFPYKLL